MGQSARGPAPGELTGLQGDDTRTLTPVPQGWVQRAVQPREEAGPRRGAEEGFLEEVAGEAAGALPILGQEETRRTFHTETSQRPCADCRGGEGDLRLHLHIIIAYDR